MHPKNQSKPELTAAKNEQKRTVQHTRMQAFDIVNQVIV